jgi:class 3 adenylate cyclase/tetratricopeptide (TPR) repeat protein
VRSVEQWLTALGLAVHAVAFEENAIDWEVLAELNDGDLRELGVTALGHRKRLLKAISELAEQSTDSTPVRSALPARAPPIAERRQLTVMFCDLAASTTLSERYDPEDLGDIVRAYQTVCGQVIDQFGGHIARYMGDGILVYFGFPLAHEDDAARALQAGLGILGAVGQLQPRPGLSLQVRIGIATGPVVVGETIGNGESREQVVLGETPNLAARLQGMAKPHSIVIAVTTKQLVRDSFVYTDLGRQTLKGFSEPVQAWQVDGIRDLADHTETRHAESALVARQQELALLAQRWTRACDGDGQAVLICGEAGIGKSRIIAAMRATTHSDGARQIVFRCSSHHANSALYPVRQHLERLLGFERADDDAKKWCKLEQVIGDYRFCAAETSQLFANLLSVPVPQAVATLRLSPQHEQERTQAALIAWIAEEAEQTPLLQVWEDLHWADPSSLQLIGALVDQLPSMRVLVLLSARLEFEAAWGARSQFTPLALARLSAADVELIVANVTGGKSLPSDLTAEIIERTDGVPLFVEEMTKAILESGALLEHADRFQLVGSIDSARIPVTLHDSLTARLDRLGAAKHLAQIAAAIGRQVHYAVLREVAALNDASLKTQLDVLVRAQLLYPRGSPPDATYVFKHALIQDTAYAGLLKKHRQQLHGSIALALRKHAGDSRPQAAILAYHFSRSAQPEKAIPHALLAGDQAVQLHARSDAASHYRQALCIASNTQDESLWVESIIDAATKLASVSTSRDEVERDLQNLMRAQALAENASDKARLCQVLYWRGRVYYVKGDAKTALTYAEQSLTIADDLGDEKLSAPPVNLLGRVSLLQGEIVRAGDLMTRSAEQMRELGDELEESSACGFVAVNFGFQGRFAEAAAYDDRAYRLALSLDNPFAQASALFMRAIICQQKGDWDNSFQTFEKCRRIADEIGDRIRVYMSLMWEGWARTQSGDAQSGLRLTEQALHLSGELGTKLMFAILKSNIAACHYAIGDMRGLVDFCEEAISVSDEAGDRMAGAYARRTYGLVLMRDDPQTASACMHEAIRLQREIQSAPELARTYQAYAEGLASIGDNDNATRYSTLAVELFSQMEMQWDLQRAKGLFPQADYTAT